MRGSLASCGRLSIGPLPHSQRTGGGNQPPRRLATCPTSMGPTYEGGFSTLSTSDKTKQVDRRQKAIVRPTMWRQMLRALALMLAAAVCAPAATFYVTIAGLGGEPDYAQRFKMWAEDIDSSLKKSGGDVNVTTLQSPTREQIRAKLGAIAGQAKATDALVVILIGHGSYDGVEYKFNIPGPAITAEELAKLMDHVPAQRQLVANLTSCSGGSIETLRRPNRIVIAATKSGSEKNATTFARYFVEALREPAADTDKN